MRNLCTIAVRNLRRYTRRSLLTIPLIAFGVIFVLVFVAVTGSFKRLITTQITDSYLGHLQVHRRGYVASIENLPLNVNLTPAQVTAIEAALVGTPNVIPEFVYSPVTNLELRVRGVGLFGGKATEYGERQNDYRLELRVRYFWGW